MSLNEATVFRSSSMAEQAAVNRKVVSSSLTPGANLTIPQAAICSLRDFLPEWRNWQTHGT